MYKEILQEKRDSKFLTQLLTDTRTERHKENGLIASPQRLIPLHSRRTQGILPDSGLAVVQTFAWMACIPRTKSPGHRGGACVLHSHHVLPLSIMYFIYSKPLSNTDTMCCYCSCYYHNRSCPCLFLLWILSVFRAQDKFSFLWNVWSSQWNIFFFHL